MPAPREPIAYAWPETPPTGLRKFNLGTIPASVTPPGTWRKAAWFAVGCAVFVVLALGFAAFRLVGSPRRIQVIDALPGQPTQQLLITDLPTDNAEDGSTSTSTRPTSTTTAHTTTRTGGTKPATTRSVRAAGSSPGEPLGTPDLGRPVRPVPVTPTTPPARSTVEPLPTPPTDPEQMGDRTELYYAQVCDDPAAAYDLTTGPMRAEGQEGIETRYSNIDHIEVEEITIDPNWSYTRSTLKVVRKDGSTVTIKRELTFSPGPNPKISGDSAAR